jgi:hypothetical protein
MSFACEKSIRQNCKCHLLAKNRFAKITSVICLRKIDLPKLHFRRASGWKNADLAIRHSLAKKAGALIPLASICNEERFGYRASDIAGVKKLDTAV